MKTVAYQVQHENGKVHLHDSMGDEVSSNNLNELLSFLLEPYGSRIKIAWDVLELVKPIMKLFPKDLQQKLKNGERVEYNGFRIWLGATRHGYIFGVSYKQRNNLRGNFYSETQYDSDIFELKQYFIDEQMPGDVYKVGDKGEYLVSILERMGLKPTRLSSAAAIYRECVLDKMPIPTIWNMPESSFPMMELCANNAREWHGDFKSGNWDDKELNKYDLTAAYPSALAGLPNLKYAEYVPFSELNGEPYWGILKGKLTLTEVVNPIVDKSGKNKIGEFEDEVITTDDLVNIEKWKLGKFEPKDGWYITLEKDVKLFDYTMRRMFDYRGGNPTRDALAKAMSVSVWGKFLEMHGDDYGKYFNGIYACMVTSKVRNRVCDFIYSNELQNDVVEVTVDGLKCSKLLGVQKVRKFGEWRKA